MSKNRVLTELEISRNQLTSLDVSKNVALTNLDVGRNQFTPEELDALFGTLHSNTIEGGKKIIYVSGNSGIDWVAVEGRVSFPACNPSIAENKGWTVW